MITAEINIEPLLRRLRSINVHTKAPLQKLVRDQAKLLVSSSGAVPGLVQLTPPFKGGGGNEAKARGLQAILRDIRGGRDASVSGARHAGVFLVLADAIVSKAVRNTNGVRLWATKTGEIYGAEEHFFKPHASVAEMEAHHRRYFKNGRMSQAGGRTRDVGRWRFIDKMIVSQRAYKRYVVYLSKKIGKLASGFNAAAQALGASGVPQWVKRHGAKYSAIRVQSSERAFYIIISSTVPFGASETSRRMAYALQYRSGALARQMPYILRAAVREAKIGQ